MKSKRNFFFKKKIRWLQKKETHTLNMFRSTGDPNKRATFQEALHRPIPEEGHLWMPTDVPSVQWPSADEELHKFVSAAILSLTDHHFDFQTVLQKQADVLARWYDAALVSQFANSLD